VRDDRPIGQRLSTYSSFPRTQKFRWFLKPSCTCAGMTE